MTRRLFSTAARRLSHENPLSLPTKGTPPNWASRAARSVPSRRPIPGVSHTIAVSSAKGGVGKSTVAANLALALARLGQRTGILDVDVFGPSIPTLFDLVGKEPRLSESGSLIPLTNYGVKTMSMGYLIPEEKPVAWRGLMVSKALAQLLGSVDWGGGTSGASAASEASASESSTATANASSANTTPSASKANTSNTSNPTAPTNTTNTTNPPGLDILILDLPPGTGDVQLSVVQQVLLSGALLVSTPSKLSQADTLRGADLFRTVDVKILGMVQNMATYTCPCCGEVSSVFGKGDSRGGQSKGETTKQRQEIDVLAEIPLDAGICETGDEGRPCVVGAPESHGARIFMELARTVAGRVGLDVRG